MEFQVNNRQTGAVKLFCLAAELGTFSSAATAAGVTPEIVSRAVARLEERLGVRLYIDTTTHIRLTAPGRSYFEKCERALKQLQSAVRERTEQETNVSDSACPCMPTSYSWNQKI